MRIPVEVLAQIVENVQGDVPVRDLLICRLVSSKAPTTFIRILIS